MEKLLTDAQGNVDFKLEDDEVAGQATGGDLNKGEVSMSLEGIKGIDGKKKFTLNTTALQSKVNAISVIRQLSENLESEFFPYIEQTWTTLKVMFEYKYSRAIRDNIRETCEFLVKSCPDEASRNAFYQEIYGNFLAACANCIQ